MTTGLKRYIKCCPTSGLTRITKCVDLGMRTAESFMITDAHELAGADDDGTNERVRLNPALALGSLGQSVTHPANVLMLQKIESPALGLCSER
jgi:hypothetical protein